MVKTYSNILSEENVTELLNYHYTIDDRIDKRPDVTSKHPRWNVDSWPQHIVKSLLDSTLDYDYEVEEVIFNQSKISFRLHVDSGYDEAAKKGHAVLIPLYCDGTSTTVFFNNYWQGNSTKFSKVELTQFEYTLPNKKGEWQHVKDLRELLAQSLSDPLSLSDFVVDNNFIDTLKYLIDARSNNKLSKLDDRCYDYKNVVNYKTDTLFDSVLHQQHLSHIPIETLHGLEIDSVVHWHPRNCIVFDRTQLHSAGTGHTEKVGVTVFTRRR
jgi:hypothetical protein